MRHLLPTRSAIFRVPIVILSVKICSKSRNSLTPVNTVQLTLAYSYPFCPPHPVCSQCVFITIFLKTILKHDFCASGTVRLTSTRCTINKNRNLHPFRFRFVFVRTFFKNDKNKIFHTRALHFRHSLFNINTRCIKNKNEKSKLHPFCSLSQEYSS